MALLREGGRGWWRDGAGTTTDYAAAVRHIVVGFVIDWLCAVRAVRG